MLYPSRRVSSRTQMSCSRPSSEMGPLWWSARQTGRHRHCMIENMMRMRVLEEGVGHDGKLFQTCMYCMYLAAAVSCLFLVIAHSSFSSSQGLGSICSMVFGCILCGMNLGAEQMNSMHLLEALVDDSVLSNGIASMFLRGDLYLRMSTDAKGRERINILSM